MDRKPGELGNGLKEVVKDEYEKRLPESQEKAGCQNKWWKLPESQEKKRSQSQETKKSQEGTTKNFRELLEKQETVLHWHL